jgi:hypothetical protein
LTAAEARVFDLRGRAGPSASLVEVLGEKALPGDWRRGGSELFFDVALAPAAL